MQRTFRAFPKPGRHGEHPPAAASGPRSGSRRRQAGFTVVELMITLVLLALSSISIVYAFSSSGISSKASERSLATKSSLQSVLETLKGQPYDTLLTWNGATVDQGDHTVTVTANLIEVGLIMIELRATSDVTGAELGRIATLRAAQS